MRWFAMLARFTLRGNTHAQTNKSQCRSKYAKEANTHPRFRGKVSHPVRHQCFTTWSVLVATMPIVSRRLKPTDTGDRSLVSTAVRSLLSTADWSLLSTTGRSPLSTAGRSPLSTAGRSSLSTAGRSLLSAANWGHVCESTLNSALRV